MLDVIDGAFYGTYDQVEINALWEQTRKCYGTEERAIEAVERQPYLLNPTYTWPPPLLSRSKVALVEVLGSEEEALEVMLKNPAVLQCGANGILELGGDEIKLFADLRYAGSQLGSQRAGALLVSLLALILLTLAGAAMDDESRAAFAPVLGVTRPLLGIVFALAIEGSRVVIVSTVFKGAMAKKDDAKAAAAARVSQAASERKAKIRANSGWAALVGNLAGSVVPLPARESADKR